MFYARKIRHRCSLPGCKNVNSTLFSASRGFTSAVYLCDKHIRMIAEHAGIISADTCADVDTSAKDEALKKIATHSTLTAAELREIAAALGVEVPDDATKDDIRALIQNA